MAQVTWTHDTADNALSADWSAGWIGGPPGLGDQGGLRSDTVHPYTVTQSHGTGEIGTLGLGGDGTLAVTGGVLHALTAYIGDIISPALVITGGTAAFGTAHIVGLSQTGGALSIASGGEVNGAFSLGADGTVAIAAGTLLIDDDPNIVMPVATFTIAGTVQGAGTLRIGSFENFVLGAGLVLTTATLALDNQNDGYGGAGTIGLAADVTYTGIVATGSTTAVGAITVDLAGHTLSLTRIGGFNANVISSIGAGTLLAAGTLTGSIRADPFSVVETTTSLAITTGAVVASNLRVDGGAVVSVGTSGAYRGTAVVFGSLDLGNGANGPSAVAGTGTVQVDGGTLALQSIGSIGFDGAFVGAGVIQFGGEGGGTLTAGATLSVATAILTGTLTLAGTVNDGGALLIQGGDLIDNNTLTVAGALAISNNAALGGTGRLIAKGGFAADRLTMFGGLTLENAGTGGIVSSISSGSSGLLGDGTGPVAIVNDAGATLSLIDVQLANYNSGNQPAALLTNHGVLIATGTITANVANDGTVTLSGTTQTLELDGTYTDTNPLGGLKGGGAGVSFGNLAVFNPGSNPGFEIGPRLVVGAAATLRFAGAMQTTAVGFATIDNGLTLQSAATLDLGTHLFNVYEASDLQGTITGTGFLSTVGGQAPAPADADLAVTGFADAGPLTLAGNAELTLAGRSTIAHNIVIGDNAVSTAVLLVGNLSTITLAGGVTLSGPSAGGTDWLGQSDAPFTELGTMLFATAIAVARVTTVMELASTGTAEVDAGTLVLAGAVVAGAAPGGQLRIGNATLELGAAVAAGETINFTTGAGYLKLDAAGAVKAPITMRLGDQIDLVGINPSNWQYSGGVLTVGGVTLNLAVFNTGATVTVTSDNAGGALVTAVPALACFAAGTRIATARGEVPVQDVVQGDFVYAQNGRLAPVVWVGRRLVDCLRHPQPALVWPVRVAAGAFGPGLPARDLFLSPDHALCLDGSLIPVRCLIDGAAVAQIAVERIEYFHIELDRHDILLAEGLPCESFLDTGQRAAFANGGAAVSLHPDFGVRHWDGAACAPLAVSGAAVAAARARLRRTHGEAQAAIVDAQVGPAPAQNFFDTPTSTSPAIASTMPRYAQGNWSIMVLDAG